MPDLKECGGKSIFHSDKYGGWWECETCHGRCLRCLEPIEVAHRCTMKVYFPAIEQFDGPRLERPVLDIQYPKT